MQADAPTQRTAAESQWSRCALESCRQPFHPGTGRGPNGSVCSRSQCRNQIYGASGKAKEVAELKARLAEKDTLIASQSDLIAALKLQLQQVTRSQLPSPQQQPALQQPPPPGEQAPVVARRPPLLQLDANADGAAPPPAKRAKDASVARSPEARAAEGKTYEARAHARRSRRRREARGAGRRAAQPTAAGDGDDGHVAGMPLDLPY